MIVIIYALLMLFLLALSVAVYLFYLFYKCDANLQLMFYEKFGKQSSSLEHSVVWITGASSGNDRYLKYMSYIISSKASALSWR